MDALIAAVCVADDLCTFTNEVGQDVMHPIDDRISSVDLLEHENCKHKILTTGGQHRDRAIIPINKYLGVHRLVTDQSAAEADFNTNRELKRPHDHCRRTSSFLEH